MYPIESEATKRETVRISIDDRAWFQMLFANSILRTEIDDVIYTLQYRPPADKLLNDM